MTIVKNVTKHPLLLGTTLLVLGTTVYGCNDFLTSAAAPQGTLNETTLANRAGVEGTLVAAYRTLDCTPSLGAWGCAASNWVWGSVTSDDSYKGSDGGDQPPINDIEGYHWGTGQAETYLGDKWETVYEGVVRANSALRLLKQVVEGKPGEIPAADAASIEGEALFLRAHYHFEAWRMWGNIPYYREDDTDFRKANILSADVVTAILSDLDAAIAKLPTASRNGQKGRANQWTAKAYKGRVQVYAGQYAAALTTLREVRSAGPYALQPSYDQVWTGFSAHTNGPETIFAFQASANDGEPDGNNANFGERLNFPYSGSPLACCGFHQPSQNLVNFFAVDAASGLPLAVTNPAGWNVSNDNFAATVTTSVDPRVDWTVGRDGVPYKDWGLHNSANDWVRDPANGGWYSPKKNVHEKSSGAQSNVGWTNTQLNSVNIHLFRYADLLLMLAEAEVEAGTLANALAIVNEIRRRAGVTAQGCGANANDVATLYPGCAGDTRIAVPIDDASTAWANYRVGEYPAFPNQDYARTAVRFERRLELAMEGQRFFDLRRWGIAAATINAYINGVGGGAERDRRLYLRAAETFGPRHALYPIPAIQIQLSQVGTESRLTQNPGW